MEKYYCILLNKIIDEGLCLDINYEAEGIFEEDEIKLIIEYYNKNNKEICETCKGCKYYPLL